MARSAADAGGWLPTPRGGSSEALGELLEACRGYLLLDAQCEQAPDLQAKGGASDLVRETLLARTLAGCSAWRRTPPASCWPGRSRACSRRRRERGERR